MQVAARVLATIDADVEPPRSVRTTGVHPRVLEVPAESLLHEVATAVLADVEADEQGRLAVITPRRLVDNVHAEVTKALDHIRDTRAMTSQATAPGGAGHEPPRVALGTDNPAALDARAVVLTVDQAKGLEFDSVLVVEPRDIVVDSAHGYTDLYVALTRPTQRLALLHTGDLPDALKGA
jgi:DNA helicase IV